MNKLICGLFGLLMAVSVETSHSESLSVVSQTDSHQSFCNCRCELFKENLQSKTEQIIADIKTKISEEKTTDFSSSIITKCQTDHYSFFGANFIRTKLSSGTEILFSTNGCQMSSEEVVQLSGANSEDGLVTKFYMAMFGVIQWKGQYLEMGFDEDNQACRIFDLSSLDKKTRQTFTTNFRKIASTSVGRTLLYRLLLEIRRTNAEGNGCIDDAIGKILASDDLDKRNACRCLEIITPYKTKSNAFNFHEKNIKFYLSKDTKKTNALGEKIKDKVEIIKTSRTDDVGLFHEMLHWFHALRDLERKKIEIALKHLPAKYKSDILLKSKEIGIDKLSMWTYQKKFGSLKKLIIETEEFRTIMGYVPTICLKTGSLKTVLYSAENILYGDDLSENLYRKITGQALRYGHVEATDGDNISIELAEHLNTFYEDLIDLGKYKITKN